MLELNNKGRTILLISKCVESRRYDEAMSDAFYQAELCETTLEDILFECFFLFQFWYRSSDSSATGETKERLAPRQE
jgi:hypothetical protein